MKKLFAAAAICAIALSLSAKLVITDRTVNDNGITYTLTDETETNYSVTGATLMMGDSAVRNASGVGVSVADSVATITLMFPATADSIYDGMRVKTMKDPIDLKLAR